MLETGNWPLGTLNLEKAVETQIDRDLKRNAREPLR